MTRLDRVEVAPSPVRLRALTTNRYLPAGRVIRSERALAAWMAEVVWPTTAPVALIRRAMTW